MKKIGEKLKFWYKRYRRKLIQIYAALLYNANFKGYFTGNIYKGSTKYACVPGLNCYSCPGAVGACPLGALQNALATSGTRTPFLMIGIILLFGLLLGRTICGFLCPVGLGQELLYKIKTPKLKKSRYTRVLSYLKYVILIVFVIAIPLMYSLSGAPIAIPAFCKYICPAGTFGGGVGLLSNANNADYFAMLGPLFTWKFALMAAIVVACVFVFRAFCRFLCPLGALYGFFNKIALIGVKLDKNKCTDCGLCIAHCKMDIKRVGDHECINCGECIDVCPAKAIRWKGSGFSLHKNAVEAAEGPVAEEKPLASLLGGVATAETVRAEALAQTPETEIAVSERAPAPQTAAPAKRKKSASFWIQLCAWIAALALLFGAIVYFNFFAEEESRAEVAVGAPCPDFTIRTYGYDQSGTYDLLEDTFTLSEHRGEVVVVNFWATWCGPCIAEIPHFERVQKENPDITILAVQGIKDVPSVPDFIIETQEWGEYTLTFAQDNIDDKGTSDISDDVCETFALLGGKDAWPITIIVDTEGTISFIRQGPLSYAELTEQVRIARGE